MPDRVITHYKFPDLEIVYPIEFKTMSLGDEDLTYTIKDTGHILVQRPKRSRVLSFSFSPELEDVPYEEYEHTVYLIGPFGDYVATFNRGIITNIRSASS